MIGDTETTLIDSHERNDRDIWRMIEGNPSIAYENEIIAYDILAEEKRRVTKPTQTAVIRPLAKNYYGCKVRLID